MSSRRPLSFDDIKYIKSVLDSFVVQGRDHAPNHLHLFCPLFYWRTLRSTFGDEAVSSILSIAADAGSGKSVSGPVDEETLAETISLGSAGNSKATLLLSAS